MKILRVMHCLASGLLDCALLVAASVVALLIISASITPLLRIIHRP